MIMKKKKIVRILLLFMMLLFFFRGWLYRVSINYQQIGVRSERTIMDKRFILKLQNETDREELDMEEIMKISNKVTKQLLSYSMNETSTDPNKLFYSQKANCIGYSAMFNSISNHLIKEANMEEVFESKHLVGKLDFFGIDLHQFFASPFFKDHDYNQLKNKSTGEVIWIDPSLGDYLKIQKVASFVVSDTLP